MTTTATAKGYGIMSKFSILSCMLLYVSIVVILLSCTEQKPQQKANSDTSVKQPTSKSLVTIRYPNDQISFHSLNKTLWQEYESARNNIQRVNTLNSSKKNRFAFFKERKNHIDNWIGRVTEIGPLLRDDYVSLKIVAEVDGYTISDVLFHFV